MAFSSGVASSPIDLFRKLREFIIDPIDGAGWILDAGEGVEIGDYESFEDVRSNGSGAYNLVNSLSDSYMDIATSTYIDFKFFQNRTVRKFKLTMPDLNAGATPVTITKSPISFRVQVSDDGANWTTVGDWTGLALWHDTESREFTLAANANTRWVRFTFPTANSGGSTYCGEIQFFDGNLDLMFVNNSVASARVLLRSPYTASGLSAHVPFHLLTQASANIFTLGCSCNMDWDYYTDEISGLPRVVGAPGAIGSPAAYSFLWPNSMPYWIYGTDRYVYIFVKVGSTYRQLGFGYLLSYSTPEQWPLPFFVGGENGSYSQRWDNDDTADIRGFTAPGNGAFHMYEPLNNAWVTFQNYYQGTGEQQTSNEYRLWPTTYHSDIANMSRNLDETISLLPLVPLRTNHSAYGELQNLFFCPGGGLTSEDTIVIGGDTYRVFQNMWRTSVRDYCAVKEV